MSHQSRFLKSAEDLLRSEDPLQPANAIYVLTGGDGSRHHHAAKLYSQGLAQNVIIAGSPADLLGYPLDILAYARRRLQDDGIPPEAILALPGQVCNTRDEALRLAALAEQKDWDNLIVVSDPFHTRRVRMTFKQILGPAGIDLMVSPSTYSIVARTDKTIETKIFNLCLEYIKLLYYLLRGRLAFR